MDTLCAVDPVAAVLAELDLIDACERYERQLEQDLAALEDQALLDAYLDVPGPSEGQTLALMLHEKMLVADPAPPSEVLVELADTAGISVEEVLTALVEAVEVHSTEPSPEEVILAEREAEQW